MRVSTPITASFVPPVLLPVSEKAGMPSLIWCAARAAVRLLPTAGALALAALPGAAQVTAVVSVDVREAGTERPLAGVEVTARPGQATAWTDAHGRVELRGLPPGRVVVQARHFAYAPADVEVVARNGATVALTLRLHPRALEVGGIEVDARRDEAGHHSISIDAVAGEVRSVVDAVERLPGVAVVRRGGPGSPAVPRIRGSAGDQVLVLVDGVAINSPLTGEADLSEVDLAQVERVVVVPGARAARYGARALAGAILIETRNPTRTTGHLRLEGGSLGRWAVGGTGSVAHATRSLTLSGGGEWQEADGDFRYPVPALRGGGTAVRDNARTRSRSAFLQGRWAPSAAADLRLRLHTREGRRGSPGTIVQPSLSGQSRDQRTGVLLQAEGGAATSGWSAALGLDRHEAVSEDPAPPFTNAYRSASELDQVEGRAEWHGEVGAIEMALGADGRRRSLTASALAEGAPGVVRGGGGWIRLRHVRGGGDRLVAALSTTVRVDRHDLLDGTVASPSATLSLTRGPHHLEVTAGNAVAPPDISDLFFQEGVLVAANPDLAPERVRGEVSVEYRHLVTGEGWAASLGLAAYRADVDGMILWVPDHRFIWSPRNIDVTRRGAEVALEVRAGRDFSARGDLAWSRVDYDTDVLRGEVVYRPRWTARLSTHALLAGLDWSAGGQWTGSRRTAPGTDLNRLPGYLRIDASVGRTVTLSGAEIAVDLAIDNLLDEGASLLADYPLPGRTFSVRLRAAPSGG